MNCNFGTSELFHFFKPYGWLLLMTHSHHYPEQRQKHLQLREHFWKHLTSEDFLLPVSLAARLKHVC